MSSSAWLPTPASACIDELHVQINKWMKFYSPIGRESRPPASKASTPLPSAPSAARALALFCSPIVVLCTPAAASADNTYKPEEQISTQGER